VSAGDDPGSRRGSSIEDYLLDPESPEARHEAEALAAWASMRSLVDRTANGPGAGRAAGAPAPVRQRLLATLGSVDRFRPFFAELQALVGLDLTELKQQLGKIDGPQDPGAGWQRAPFPGVRYLDFTPGPAAGVPEAGLVRVAAGALFPRHQHVTRERACILEGSLILEGRSYYPGTVVDSPAGSSHEFTAGPGRDLVLVVAHGGIRFGRGSE
jgi:hypothetical protein